MATWLRWKKDNGHLINPTSTQPSQRQPLRSEIQTPWRSTENNIQQADEKKSEHASRTPPYPIEASIKRERKKKWTVPVSNRFSPQKKTKQQYSITSVKSTDLHEPACRLPPSRRQNAISTPRFETDGSTEYVGPNARTHAQARSPSLLVRSSRAPSTIHR